MQLFYQYIAIFFNFSPTSNRLHPLQAENCDSNSRLVVDEDDNGKFRLERVNTHPYIIFIVPTHFKPEMECYVDQKGLQINYHGRSMGL